MLHWIPKVLYMRLLGHSIWLWELILAHSLHSHLLLHKRHLRLLRVYELLLLLCLALSSVIYPFQLRPAVGLVGCLWIMSADEAAFMQVTHPVWRLLKLLLLERRGDVEGFGKRILGFDQG